jgi:hypothetical protein
VKRTTRLLGFHLCLCVLVMASTAVLAQRPGLTDTIRISKQFYVANNKTLLISAVSNNAKAHLYLYRSSGSFLGEVQNGAGGKYGGSVFFAGPDPVSLTIVSSAGGKVTFRTTPYHP